ncbi:MAG TPA: hypothetical protein VEC56_03020 [Candidatus Krumholzibacteria bacterium]|nr:hypothetical protein [Candidatus Krumholzibacteria bacterium]
MKRVAALFLAAALVAAVVIHGAHGHDEDQHASRLHATCVVCQLGSPVATQPVALPAVVDASPVCQLSIADRDRAIPPARVEVDLSRAPPLAS